MRVRHNNHGQPEGRDLGQRRGTRPTDHQVRRREGQRHLLVEESLGAVAVAQLLRQGVSSGNGTFIPGIAGYVNGANPLCQQREGTRYCLIEAADGLGATEDQQQLLACADSQGLSGFHPADASRVSDRSTGHVAGRLPAAQRGAG